MPLGAGSQALIAGRASTQSAGAAPVGAFPHGSLPPEPPSPGRGAVTSHSSFDLNVVTLPEGWGAWKTGFQPEPRF